MSEERASGEFIDKFNALNVNNQRYIIAIQEALVFAQTNEKISRLSEEEQAK